MNKLREWNRIASISSPIQRNKTLYSQHLHKNNLLSSNSSFIHSLPSFHSFSRFNSSYPSINHPNKIQPDLHNNTKEKKKNIDVQQNNRLKRNGNRIEIKDNLDIPIGSNTNKSIQQEERGEVKKEEEQEKKSSKWENRMREIERTQWHKRQKVTSNSSGNNSGSNSIKGSGGSGNSNKLISKNQQFKMIQPDVHFVKEIARLNVARQKKMDKKGPKSTFAPFQSKTSHSFKYLGKAQQPSSFFPNDKPEVAIIGRSNVGKSSFLNAIADQYISRTSAKPGMTQSVIWIGFGNNLYLVDLPGYGFSLVNEEKKELFRQLYREYFLQRTHLQLTLLLLDGRHSIRESDFEMIEVLEKCKRKYQIVLTKCDLVEAGELARRATLIKQELIQKYRHSHHFVDNVLFVSSYSKNGIDEMRQYIESFSKTPIDEAINKGKVGDGNLPSNPKTKNPKFSLQK
eukprot:TRINITY_DN5680_c0_g1_i1.p1 TRINITY_DN5680_c0_g1~~TRINITY_DN5680_c0_g1_i1.p1  ORF type:complete len:456 (-),score=131.94 TRINITY_DN5680_c0_g1_i1:8-1375(-)